MTTGEDKAALILSRMPTDLIDVVLAQIPTERSGLLRNRLEEFRKTPAPRSLLEQAVADIRDLLRVIRPSQHLKALSAVPGQSEVPSPGAVPGQPAVPSVTTEAEVGPEKAAEHASAATESQEADPAEALQALAPDALAAVLRNERVLVVLMALDRLPSDKVGEVLKQLPAPLRREAALRMGQTTARSPELTAEVSRAVMRLARKLVDQPDAADPEAHVKKLAGLLRNLDREDRKEILASLLNQDPVLGEKVKQYLYLFDDLLRLEARSLQDLLGQVNMRTLAVALRGASDAIKEKVLGNLSARAGVTLQEEISLLSSTPPDAVKQAQASVAEILQVMDQEGKLVMVD